MATVDFGYQAQAKFDELVACTRRQAYSFALRLTYNRDDALDLTQETFLKAWKGFVNYRPDRPFINWVFRIMLNAFIDLRRRDNPVRRAESLNSMVSPSDGEVQEIFLPDPRPNAEEVIISSELGEELNQALASLEPQFRRAVILCDVGGLSYAEIAEITETTTGTVRSRIHRGRLGLRRRLSK